MRANHEELVLMLTTLTGLDVQPQGQETDASVYLTYLDIPGGVTAAYDGGGPYPVVWQIDCYARSSDLYTDPEDATFAVAEQILAYIKPRHEWFIRQMPTFTAPSEDAQGFARASFKLIRTYSF